MARIRVLVVDDSVVVRRIVTNVLGEDRDIEVVGVAANGRIALSKLSQLDPDIVTLDVEMPEMDGLETIARIREDYPKLPVIMFSTLTARGATTTLEALSLGATDYVTKPANVGAIEESMEQIRRELIPKIKALCVDRSGIAKTVSPSKRQERTGVTVALRQRKTPLVTPNIVVIGVSTGGPNTLAELIPRLPEDLPVPVLIVQHMPALFTRYLAERLDKNSDISVAEGSAETVLQPGHVLIAPGDYHMGVMRSDNVFKLFTNQDAPENSVRPAADVLFRSVARVYGAHVVAVVLTGMGLDGLVGCEHIAEAGGQILVQDEHSAVVWGMAGAVAKAGLADKVLPLDEIAEAIKESVMGNRVSRNTSVTVRDASAH